MWETSNNTQIISFLMAVLFGTFYCAYYDIFRSIRAAGFNKPVSVFWQDIFFFLTTAIVTFLLMLVYSNGEIRFYILFGILIGFLSFNFTLSRFLRRLFTFVLKKFIAFFRVLKRSAERLSFKISKVARRIAEFFQKNCKKTAKTLKNLLKRKR